MTSAERKWCDLCGQYIYPEDEPASDCAYFDCPMARITVRDTRDELGQVLGEALADVAPTDPPSTPPGTSRPMRERQ